MRCGHFIQFEGGNLLDPKLNYFSSSVIRSNIPIGGGREKKQRNTGKGSNDINLDWSRVVRSLPSWADGSYWGNCGTRKEGMNGGGRIIEEVMLVEGMAEHARGQPD